MLGCSGRFQLISNAWFWRVWGILARFRNGSGVVLEGFSLVMGCAEVVWKDPEELQGGLGGKLGEIWR